jgi:hypothetical protein
MTIRESPDLPELVGPPSTKLDKFRKACWQRGFELDFLSNGEVVLGGKRMTLEAAARIAKVQLRPGKKRKQIQEERKLIRDALGVKRVRAWHWAHIDDAAARYLRDSPQDEAARPLAHQKVALCPIASLSKDLADRLAGLDDESLFRLVAAGADDLEDRAIRLAGAARSAVDGIGETRGRQRRLESLKILVAELATIWCEIKNEPVTLDRVKISTGYVPSSASAIFIGAVVKIVDQSITPEQLITAIGNVRPFIGKN